MFEKLLAGEIIHDTPKQTRTCNHPIYTQMVTGVCQEIRTFSLSFFHAFISTGILESDLILYLEVFLVELPLSL